MCTKNVAAMIWHQMDYLVVAAAGLGWCNVNPSSTKKNYWLYRAPKSKDVADATVIFPVSVVINRFFLKQRLEKVLRRC
jgi:hypothetical protein